MPIGSTVTDNIRFTFEDPEGLHAVSQRGISHTQPQNQTFQGIDFIIEGTDTPVPPTAGSTVVTWDGGPASDDSNNGYHGQKFEFRVNDPDYLFNFYAGNRWTVTHTAADNSQPDSFVDTLVGHNGANVSFNGYIDPATDEVFASEPNNGNFITFAQEPLAEKR